MQFVLLARRLPAPANPKLLAGDAKVPARVQSCETEGKEVFLVLNWAGGKKEERYFTVHFTRETNHIWHKRLNASEVKRFISSMKLWPGWVMTTAGERWFLVILLCGIKLNQSAAGPSLDLWDFMSNKVQVIDTVFLFRQKEANFRLKSGEWCFLNLGRWRDVVNQRWRVKRELKKDFFLQAWT